ncbi:restriction endonuclease [Ruminococcus sp. OM05-10BH]|nr:restriction endonuclease [Ruminococcus sp. OM05-10BH]
MTPQELKNSILQLAIQGKLVEQRPEEGTAEELFAKIQEEKQRLIAEKKIKKGKPLPEITEDEKPFDIPESWKWVRLRDVANVTGGYAFKSTSFCDSGVRVIRISDFNENGFINNKIVRHPFDESLTPFLLESKNILLCMTGGTVGKSYFVRNIEEPMMTNQRVATIKIIVSIEEYINFVILSSVIQKIIRTSKNSTNDNISMDIINSFPIPLPPLAEQKRIVAKIEELLPYINRYEQAWSKLEQFNSRFPEDMKKSLLQYAIQGKLVEQRPEEGTAEELFAQIQEEKQRLIAEKKIKKEKPLPEITDDEKPFDIPESWKWVRIGEIFAHNTGKAMNSSAKKVDKAGSIRKFITTSNLYWNSFDFSSVKEMFFSDDELERCTVTKGDLLMCEGGAYYGRTAIWNYDYDICFQNHIHRLRSYKPVELMFFYHLFYFYKSMNMMKAKGTAMPGLSSQTLHQMPVPLPPLAEQKRIVEKLEQLLPLCERLK